MREDLVEATYRDQTTRLCESAVDLLERLAPIAALQAWMEAFVDYTLTKHGMADALPAILAAQEGLRAQSRERLRQAVALLLAACSDAGATRPVDAGDVLMALGGITLIAAHENQRELATRLIALLTAGLRP